MSEPVAVFTPKTKQAKSSANRAMALVGGMLNIPINSAVDMVKVTRDGIVPDAVDALIDQGFTRGEIAWIVPPRTLSHRRNKKLRLTTQESGRWFRAARIRALANVVLGDNDKANLWLHKPRIAFNGLNAIELMKAEAGAQMVEEALGQLDTGYFA